MESKRDQRPLELIRFRLMWFTSVSCTSADGGIEWRPEQYSVAYNELLGHSDNYRRLIDTCEHFMDIICCETSYTIRVSFVPNTGIRNNDAHIGNIWLFPGRMAGWEWNNFSIFLPPKEPLLSLPIDFFPSRHTWLSCIRRSLVVTLVLFRLPY